MADIAAAVGTAVLNTLVEKLVSLTVDEAVKAASALKQNAFLHEVRSLERKLKLVRELLDDAEAKQIQSPAIRDWLSELKDAAYDAEDVLDEYASRVAVLQQRKDHFRKWIKKKVNQLGLTDKIKSINRRFDSLSNEINSLGLQKLKMPNKGNLISAQGRQSTSLLDVNSPIIGRDGVKHDVIKLLRSNEVENNTTKLPVLPIVGMRGVGKTSLAQLVFHDESLKEHFHLRIWVFVSQNFDPCKILRSIIEYIYADSGEGKTCNSSSLESLQNETKKLIEKRKFLLILDDVWNEQQHLWEQLLTPLKLGKIGSKVLMTTRSQTVAKSIDGHMNPVNLESMDDNYIWEILKSCAFNGVADLVDDENLKNIGRHIVEKLKGSPLAAKTIGRLLSTNLDKNHWKMILESDLWELKGQNELDIMPSPWLSYQYLPSILKICFSLCSLFPKGHQIPKDKLSYIWIAHGIFQLEHKTTPEISAAEAIQNLISMSLLFEGESDDTVIMHDLIHDFSKFVSREDHLQINGNIIPEKHPPKLRHLSIFWESFSEMKWESELSCDNLRSMLCTVKYLGWHADENKIGGSILNGWLDKSKCLRVLDLDNFPVQVLPNSIGKLKHLRYLNLSNTNISELPKSLTSLYNLQALWLENCHWLKKLPDGMGNLVSLRLLKVDEWLLFTIKDIGIWSTLPNLRYFDVDPKNGWGIEELENLGMFGGKLTIQSLENVVDIVKARKASLQQNKYLEDLTLQWTYGCVLSSETAEKILEALQPNGDHLKRLKIINYGGTVSPSWLATGYHFISLVELELLNWESCADFGPIICNLNNFESLELLSNENLVCRGKASLRKVRIYNWQTLLSLHLPTSVEEVDIDGYLAKDVSLMTSLHGMTSLRRLSLENSPNLTQLLEKEVVMSLLERSLQRSVLENGNPGFNVRFGKDLESYWKLQIGPYNDELLSSDVKVQSRSGRWVWELLQHITSHLGQYVQELMFTCPDEEIVKDGELEDLFVSLTNLSKLRFNRYKQLVTLLTRINGLSTLLELWLRDCPDIQSWAASALPASLQQLSIINCDSLTSLPSDMARLTSIESLELRGCPKIESLADIVLPASLKLLTIYGCERLASLPSDMRGLASLQELSLRDCPSLHSFPNSGLPPPLSTLYICNCPGLQSFPECGLPPSLSYLDIRYCPGLQSFPESGLPPSLSTLRIYNCPALKEKYRSGPERALISHIPEVDWL